jgi:hypothetical protein
MPPPTLGAAIMSIKVRGGSDIETLTEPRHSVFNPKRRLGLIVYKIKNRALGIHVRFCEASSGEDEGLGQMTATSEEEPQESEPATPPPGQTPRATRHEAAANARAKMNFSFLFMPYSSSSLPASPSCDRLQVDGNRVIGICLSKQPLQQYRRDLFQFARV